MRRENRGQEADGETGKRGSCQSGMVGGRKKEIKRDLLKESFSASFI